MTDENPPHECETDTASVSRRAAVRRAATVLGLGAGAVVLPGLTSSAAAKPGDPVVAGGSVAAGQAQTSLKSSGSSPTLRIENARSRSGPVQDTVDLISPQLQLGTPVPSLSRPQVPDARNMPPGSLAAAGGMLFFGADVGREGSLPAQVYTSEFATMLHPLPQLPIVLDSAALTDAARAAYPAGSFDAQGRLTGQRIRIDLRQLINTQRFAQLGAVCLSVTASGADSSGAVLAHPDGTRDASVTLVSYTVLPAEVSANGKPFAMQATAAALIGLDTTDALWLSVSSASHVRVQLTAVLVAEPSALVEPSVPDTNVSDAQLRRARQRQAVRELSAQEPPAK